MAHVPSGSVNLVVTDPPYCVGTTSNGTRGSWSDNNLIVPFFKQFFAEIDRVLAPDGEFYLHTDWRTYPLLYPLMVERFSVPSLIVWDFGWIKAGSHYRHTHEFIIYATRPGVKRRFGAGEPDVWRNKPLNFTRPEKRHQTEKPLGLTARIIRNSSDPLGLVLDPFAGSGTVGVACRELGRRFVGFEISPQYHAVAESRLNSPLPEDERLSLAESAS